MAEITLQLRIEGEQFKGNGYAQGYGWFNTAYSIGTLLGPLIAGWLVEKWGWAVLCYTMGAVAGLTVIPILLFTGEKRRVDDQEI
jgi:MFS family permease